MSTAARAFGFSGSVVSGWSTLEYVATADTARVSVTGVRRGRLGPLLRLDDARRSDELHGRVIFFIDSVDLIRARYSRRIQP